jgi:hypothetical protein
MLESLIAQAQQRIDKEKPAPKAEKKGDKKADKKSTKAPAPKKAKSSVSKKVNIEVDKIVVPEPEPVLPAELDLTTIEVPAPIDQNVLMDDFISNVNNSIDGLTTDQQAALTEGMNSITDSFLSAVKTCNTDTCSLYPEICPFSKIKKYPVNKVCPIELTIARQVNAEYYRLLQEETGNVSFSIVEKSTVQNLVEIELEEFRSRAAINRIGQTIEMAAFAVKETGEIIYNPAENPLYNTVDRLGRRKQRLLSRLLMTPEAKARFKIDIHRSSNDKTKEILARAEDKIKKFKAPGLNK